MSLYRLKRLDDVVVGFRVLFGDRPIGEIRREDVHAESLHLGERRYWLLHEEAAAADTLLGRWLGRLRLDRTHVLRDGDTELARARRHWTAFGGRDWIEFRAPGDAQSLRVEAHGLLAGDIRLQRGGVACGTLSIDGPWRDEARLAGTGLTPPQAVLLLLAVLRAWGNDPHVRHY